MRLRNMSVRSRVLTFAAELRSMADPPFVAVYDVDADFTLPDAFRLSAFRGLLHVEVVRRSEHEAALLLYWSSDSSYQLAAAQVARLLRGATLRLKGVIGASQARGASFWPTTASDALLKAS